MFLKFSKQGCLWRSSVVPKIYILADWLPAGEAPSRRRTSMGLKVELEAYSQYVAEGFDDLLRSS
jgi:hypothetical protein